MSGVPSLAEDVGGSVSAEIQQENLSSSGGWLGRCPLGFSDEGIDPKALGSGGFSPECFLFGKAHVDCRSPKPSPSETTSDRIRFSPIFRAKLPPAISARDTPGRNEARRPEEG